MRSLINVLDEINQKNLKIVNSDQTLMNKFVFRGQSNAEWNVNAKLFRADYKHLLGKEHILIQEYIKKFPEFETQPTINVLADMQHFGLPTRLIDWSTNPLVALYFACSDPEYLDRDGKVFFCNYSRPEVSHCKIISELICEVSQFDFNSPHFDKNNLEIQKTAFAYLVSSYFIKTITLYGAPQNLEQSIGSLDDLIHNDFMNVCIDALKHIYGENETRKDNMTDKLKNFLKATFNPIIINAPRVNQRIISQNGMFQICNGKEYRNLKIMKACNYNFPESCVVIIYKQEKIEILEELNNRFDINANSLHLAENINIAEFLQKI